MEVLKLENYSYEDYLKIDKSTKERVELIFGKIYMMVGASAKHQDVVGNIFFTLKSLQKKCKPRVVPFDLVLRCKGEKNVVQPDVMLFCDEKLPCAIFEVLSPSTASKDKGVKFELYGCAGIKEYYIVEPEYKTVEQFILEDGKYVWKGNFVSKEKIEIGCIDTNIEVDAIFEGVE